jgi:hypothetical protein
MGGFFASKANWHTLLSLSWATVLPLLMIFSTVAFPEDAQPRNEFVIGIGRTFISDQRVPNTNFFDNSVHSGKGLSLSFNYTRQFFFFRWGAVGVEVPVIYNPDEDLNYGLNVVPKQYSSVFVTPALHVSFVRNFFISPWLSFGGGIGHFAADKELEFNNTPNPGPRIKTTGVMHGGIGFDVPLPKKLLDLRFRFEACDNWSGEPPVNVDTGRTRQHNYYVGGGAVFRF